MRPIKSKNQQQKYEQNKMNKKQSIKDSLKSIDQLSKMSASALKQQLKHLKGKLMQKQSNMLNAQKMYRIESFRNQKLKQEVIQTSNHCELVRKKVALDLFNKNKRSKDSPLFYNQVGLCPFQLMLIDQAKFQSYQTHICMVCFSDIMQQSVIINLPCDHMFHKQCAVQNLLYSKNCPACGQEVNIANHFQNKISPSIKKNMQKNNENLLGL